MLRKWILYSMLVVFLVICAGICLPLQKREWHTLYTYDLNIAIVGAVVLILLFFLYVTLEYRRRKK